MLSRLVVDFEPPENFEARVVLEENGSEDSRMLLYLAEKGTVDTYLEGYMYKLQEQFSVCFQYSTVCLVMAWSN